MKKLVLFFAVIIAVSLASCGNKKSAAEATPATTDTTVAPAATDTTAAAAANTAPVDVNAAPAAK